MIGGGCAKLRLWMNKRKSDLTVKDARFNIVVVGGGSAGWLTAGILAAEFQQSGADAPGITLIESPDVPTLGVGEGTWPTMRETLRRIGVREADFVRECDAAFKQASCFRGWVTGEDEDSYYHPFSLPQGFLQSNVAAHWLRGAGGTPFARSVSAQPAVCDLNLAPKQAQTPEFAGVTNYGYHLDAGKFGQFLKKHCVDLLGVTHILDNVVAVQSEDNGDIAGLTRQNGETLHGDLFIDCTGFSSLLLGKHYQVPLRAEQNVLFNDTALAVQVPYAEGEQAVASHTYSTAQEAGWVWDIGLPTRRGVGYVYSSEYQSAEQAHDTLFRYLKKYSGVNTASLPEPRTIALNPGYRAQFWHRNCVGIGISGGFIEPLEASALVMIELGAAMVRDALPLTRDTMEMAAQRFNETFRYRWERIIEFLKLHYVLSQRNEPYWRAHRDAVSIPERLREQLAQWQARPPSRLDFPHAEEIFPAASYQYVLYGMGFKPSHAPLSRRSDEADMAAAMLAEIPAMSQRFCAGLPSHRDYLLHVQQHGMPVAGK